MTTEIPAWHIRPGQPIVKEEMFDPDIIDALLCDVKSFSETNRKRLSAYKKGRSHGNHHMVVYDFARDCGGEAWGRLYVRDYQGLQSFPFDIRNPLLEPFYWDCDMENCHYWLFLQIGDRLGVKTEAIRQYCENREEELVKVSGDRKIAKRAFLKVGYGGSIKEIQADWGYLDCIDTGDDLEPEGDQTLLRKIEEEIGVIRQLVWVNNPEMQKFAKRKKRKNPLNSVFALYAQTEERKCLLSMERWLTLRGRNVDVLIHDGCSIRKLEDEKCFDPALLRGAEKAILEATGYTMHLAIKPWAHSFRPPPVIRQIIVDDEYAARQFVALCGEFIKRDEDNIFYFDSEIGMWSDHDDAFRHMVQRHKEAIIFKTFNEEGKERVHNFGGVEKNVASMRKWIRSLLPDTKFLSRNADTSIGKLLFTDGIFDFERGFTAGFNPNVVFLKRIDRPFPATIDEELIARVNKILFIDAFGDEKTCEVGTFFKKAITMGIYGDYWRKKFYVALGDANCGKGVTVGALKEAFCGYVDEFCANELLYNPGNSQDESRRLAWLKDLKGARIAFSNEMRMDGRGADGNLIKGATSGGDQHKVRGNYESGEKYVNRTTLFSLANDFTKITPSPSADSGLQERLQFMRFTRRFVDDPKTENEMLKDRSIKQKFTTDEWKNALFYVIWRCWQTMDPKEREVGGDLDTPDSVKAETVDWVTDGDGTLFSVIEERFEITHDFADTVLSKELVSYVTSRGLKMSPKKIGLEIRKLIHVSEWEDDQKTKVYEVRTGSKNVYHGIKPI
jgi:hypothetical protein